MSHTWRRQVSQDYGLRSHFCCSPNQSSGDDMVSGYRNGTIQRNNRVREAVTWYHLLSFVYSEYISSQYSIIEW